MNKLSIKILLLLTMSFTVTFANSAAFHCTGKVSMIGLSPTGGLLQVNAGHGVHYLCRLQSEYQGVPPEVCKAWYSMFLAAQASSRDITMSYNSNNGVAQNCNELGSWKTPSPFPYFVQLVDYEG